MSDNQDRRLPCLLGEVTLIANEYKTAERLKKDHWLHVVFGCAGAAKVYAIRDPGRLGWQRVVQVEHYQVRTEAILEAAS